MYANSRDPEFNVLFENECVCKEPIEQLHLNRLGQDSRGGKGSADILAQNISISHLRWKRSLSPSSCGRISVRFSLLLANDCVIILPIYVMFTFDCVSFYCIMLGLLQYWLSVILAGIRLCSHQTQVQSFFNRELAICTRKKGFITIVGILTIKLSS